jgi:CRISPR/Cas system CSM-associated protein Csm4 (group 5 of RAMP superfamily)
MIRFEFEFGEFSRHFQNSNSPNIREFEYEFELSEFFPTPDSAQAGWMEHGWKQRNGAGRSGRCDFRSRKVVKLGPTRRETDPGGRRGVWPKSK